MSDDNNETIEQSQNETATTRIRTFTEKGKEYHLNLAKEQRKATYKRWRKQLNKLSALVVDIEDVTQLREERNKLIELFDELTTQQEKVEEYLTDKDELGEMEEDYERWDRDSVEVFRAVNGKIADLIAYDSESRSSRTCSSTRTRSTMSKKSTRHASKLVDKDETLARKKAEIERLRLLDKLENAKAELTVLQMKQEEQQTEIDEVSERDRLEEYLETQMKSVGGKPENPTETYSEAPSMKETNENDGISRLADLLAQNQIRDHLPRPEPEIFDGNLLRFPLWMKSFQTLIESRTAVPAERLYYLGRYTRGEAKEVIEGVLPLTTADAYDKAKALLRERFGNPFLVSNAYRRKINDWPKIQVNDGPGLRKFADFLEACKTASTEIKFLKVLDDPDENQKMLQKLPNYVVNGWSRIVDRWVRGESNDTEGGAYPPFSEFCKFLQTEARIACNPVTSLRSFRARDEEKKAFPLKPARKDTHLTSFATSSNVNAVDESAKQTTINNARKNNCLMCNGNHSIDVCPEFLKLQLTERKKFVTEKRLCWGCLRAGHRSRQCRSKRTCDVCQGPHPSCLHNYSYGSNSQEKAGNPQSDGHVVSNRVRIDHAEHNEPVAMHSLIVPVWLHHVDNPDKAVVVYALLDEQSDACFVRESTLNKLTVNGPKVNIQLSTVLGQKTIESRKVEGLVVKGVKEHAEIKLPKVYSRETIPAKRSQIPRTATALEWPHLQHIAEHLTPYSSELEIGLLLGINCSSAIKPLQVIPGKEDEPYAKKTKLGWGIVGMVKKREDNDSESEHNDNEEVIVNQTIIREVKLPQGKTACHFSFQTQVKEVIQPSQVLQMFEMDFNSKEIEKGSLDLSIQDKKFLEIVGGGIRQLPDSHYIMPLPLKTHVQLENNFEMALRRLTHLKRRFLADEKYREDYAAFMQAVIDSGHAEKVNENTLSREDGKVWYIPHHGVYHPHKPGKIRVVFDCSATYKGQSLNKQLIQGPDLANSLIGVICRFRLEPIALMCDIEKMFHQVKVQENCRDLLRFLWWDNANIDSDPKVYRMTVHLFGAVSSPACVNYALKKVADDFQEECGGEAASFVKEDFYVDDGLKSVATVEEAIQLVNNVRTLCSKGGFHLHKFVSNSDEVLQSIPEHERANEAKIKDIDKEVLPIERALGVHWCVESDTIEFRITLKDRPFTRRGILATVSSVFDPLGLVSPVILTGKKILQSLCQQSVGWDEKVPDDIRPRWEKWRADLHSLSALKVDRCVKPKAFTTLKSAEMHHFSDASTEGYGQCSYLRLTDDNDQVHCTLTMAKSRVTPLKPVTIPRLELSAALVSARISQLLQQEMSKLNLIDVFWTDSKIALGYIYNEAKRFHVFVSNRVQQIRDVSSPEQWHYVTSAENPADHASRGLTAKQLVECDQWWNGPKFLSSPSLEYTASESELMENDPEIKKVQCLSTKTTEFPSFISRLEYFSDWYRAKRTVARILRLQNMFKKGDNSHLKDRVHPFGAPLTVQELQDAEILIIKELQRKHYAELIAILSTMGSGSESAERSYAARRIESLKKTTSLYHLDPFLENGLLRVGGRLKLAEIPHDEKHPLIVPRKSHVTNLILCHFHEKVCHQGRCITQNEVRASGYWITGGKSVISNHIAKCVKCRRLRGTLQLQKMADLPKDRIEPSPPFTYSAVDCFGPFVIKEGRKRLKRYGALFTCMASRAVHLEVCNSMDADSFLNAYRRFVGRRGPVRQLRSDQGTNFMGGKNELHKALLEMNGKIHDALLKNNCDWVVFKSNVPHASHMGGVWERQIKSVRNVLNAVLQSQGDQLDDESLRTLMVESEAIVNSRPLAVESASSIQISPISPSNLLTMKSKVILSPPGTFDRPDLYSRKRWRRVQYMANEFWFKWRKTYLQSLQQRPKWQATKENVKVDDIVIVKDEGLPRNKWPLARVNEIYASDDGKVRKVQIAVADSSADDKGRRKGPLTLLQRPVHKLVVLCSKGEE